MNVRSSTRTVLAVLILIALAAGVVLSRAIPGLPERVTVTADEASVAAWDEPTPVIPDGSPPEDPPEQPEPETDGKKGAAEDPKPKADPESERKPSSAFFPELEGDELRSALKSAMEAGHAPLSYRKAREAMYWIVDNRSGTVTTIYAKKPLRLKPGEWPRQQDLNCEHVWPQSKGSKRMPMKTDLFHLRPAVPRVNSTRSNHPFGVPVSKDDPKTAWHVGPDEDGDTVFMPPPDHRGDISRSMFYFSVRYGMNIDEEQEEVLRTWHREDPVDERERRRVDLVEEKQGNRNLFVDDPEVVERITDF